MNRVPDYDLTAPETFLVHDLRELWRDVRTTAPVYWHPHKDSGFWVVSRYRDVLAVYRDSEHFTSQRGTVLDVLLTGPDPAGGRMLAVTDGPRHRAVRKVMSRFFAPVKLAAVADSIRRRTDRIIGAAVERDGVDFATDVADRLPIEAICDFMAIPEADRPHLLACNKAVLSADGPDASAMDATTAKAEILLYLADLVAERRRHPGDDVVSALAGVRVDGAPLDDDDLALNCYSLILGGDESTRMSACTAAVLFADRPQEWARIRDGAAVDTAVEEILRWSTPSMHFCRTAVADVELGGRQIRAGDVVSLWNTSANFDDEVFADPDRFDVTRKPNDHLAFGQGRHYCLGAALARMELRILLEVMRQRVARVERLAEPRRVYSTFLFGYSSVPARLVPAH